MEDSPQELMDAAHHRLIERGKATEARERYRELERERAISVDFDSHNLTQRIMRLDQPGGLLPLRVPTLRGKLSMAIIRCQSSILWWLMRAIRLRDDALKATLRVLEEQHRRQCRLDGQVAALEQRIKDLEERRGH